MTAKEYLNEIRTLGTIINQKRQELDTLHEIATAIGSFDYSKDRVQTSPSGDAPFTRMTERATELDEELRGLNDKYSDAIRRMDGICQGLLTDEEHNIIAMRYYCGWSWAGIMAITDNKDRTIYRIHNRALEKLQGVVVSVDLSV